MTSTLAVPGHATAIDADQLHAALSIRDLTDPAAGPHAMQTLLAAAVDVLAARWGCAVELRRSSPLVPVEDNYDRLGYPPSAATRAGRHSRYVSDTVMLRSHTSAGVPPALRALAADPEPPADVLVVLPGLTHRRDVVDRLHVGTPHQVDLWRIVRDRTMAVPDLLDMVDALVSAVLPGAQWRSAPASHPYTSRGLQIDVRTDTGWVELAECGLAAPHVLATGGLAPARHTGLALGMGLDRALMLRKGVPDIRLLRAADPPIAEQMLDLRPWRAVSALPAVRRDLSIVLDGAAVDPELLGDRVRTALGPDADALESLAVLAATPHAELPAPARARLGTRPGEVNVLLRLVLRPVDRTLTDAEANAVRDRVYAALHEGPHHEWATS
jgi:phenylalanyl-tRNA synthetase alpha chain